MPNEVLMTLISLGGILLSALVSFAVSSINTRTEFRKLKAQFQQTFVTKLVEQRIIVYPQLYFVLSDFFKRAKTGDAPNPTVPVGLLQKWLGDINAWDSQHALLLSSHAFKQIGELRYRIFVVISQVEANPLTEIQTDTDDFRVMMQSGENLEFALRSDIGVYEVDVANVAKRVLVYSEDETTRNMSAVTR